MKSIYRILTVVLLAILSVPAMASHVIGGDIQYEYLGNNQYYVKLVIYRQSRPGSATLGNTQNVQVASSSCGVNTFVTLQRTQQYIARAEAFKCIAESNAAGFIPEVNVYETTVSAPLTLTQRCSDYKLSWQLCCRPGGITNIGTGNNSAGYSFYFEAELNNRLGLGNNTSPAFVSDPIAYICTGGYINYLQKATEPDGDSINYTVIDPRSAAGTNVPYNTGAGFSVNNPFTTDPSSPYTVDANTGNISFIAQLPAGVTNEVSVIALRVDEYRFDSTYFFWEKVGSSNREIQVVIASNCLNVVNQGVRLDPAAPGVSLDARGRQTKDYSCYDSTVTLHFTLPVECVSVAPDGTDFRLTAPNGQPIPVESITPYCNQNGETDSVTLKLYKPLIFNGDYYLYSKYGTDGNTLLNACGKPMNEFDTIVLKVENCLDPDYGWKGVTVEQDKRNRIEFDIDTATIPVEFINFVRVYRSSDSGRTYQPFITANPLDGFTLDGLGAGAVDNQYYNYKYSIIANGLELPLTDGLHTINLKGDVSNPASMPLRWSNYGGASFPDVANVEYKVQVGEKLDSGGYDFQDVIDGGVLPMSDSSYTVEMPGSSDPGEYAVRIVTTPMPNGGYVSESNWIIFNVPTEPIIPPDAAVPVRVPNVITPDGDLQNDVWTIEGIETWESRGVSIYSRWGDKVWSTAQYSNDQPFMGLDKNGNKLADGTYFYVIDLNNSATSQAETLNGSVNIMGVN